VDREADIGAFQEGTSLSFINETYWIAWRELKRYLRSRIGMISRLLQPVVWLGFVGNIFSDTRPLLQSVGFPSGYLDYMTPGAIAMVVLFTGIFGGMTTLWDRRFGYFQKILATPVSRYAIALGKVLAISVIAGIQAFCILGIAFLLGVQMGTGVLGVVGIIIVAMILGCGFAAVSIIIGTKAATQEAFWGIINFMGLPLLFMSSALFPLTLMPNWLASLAKYNPLTYAIDAIRFFVTPSFRVASGVGLQIDMLTVLAFALVAVIASAYVFTREVQRSI
jgi:ABC-2 type transport system permease protein